MTVCRCTRAILHTHSTEYGFAHFGPTDDDTRYSIRAVHVCVHAVYMAICHDGALVRSQPQSAHGTTVTGNLGRSVGSSLRTCC